MQTNDLERTGPHFNLETYLKARENCIEAVEEIAQNFREGMNEKDAQVICKEIFKKRGAAKFWHPSKLRVGSETIKNFSETPDQTVTLKSGDIYFIDVGPIIDLHEADFGRSYVLGHNPELQKLADATEEIFNKTATHWKKTKATGKELYEYASQEAHKMGYSLNKRMAGHRLGDFPHKVFSSENLLKLDKTPIKNLWVLEIHLIDEKLNRGAFFEDILTEE